jgi:hypothetical protein
MITRARHDFDEEAVAELLRELRFAPASWVQAAKELPAARRELDGIAELSGSDPARRGEPLCEIDHIMQESDGGGRHVSRLRDVELARTTGGTMGSEEGRFLREEDDVDGVKKPHRGEDVEGHVADPEGRFFRPEDEDEDEGEGVKRPHRF